MFDFSELFYSLVVIQDLFLPTWFVFAVIQIVLKRTNSFTTFPAGPKDRKRSNIDTRRLQVLLKHLQQVLCVAIFSELLRFIMRKRAWLTNEVYIFFALFHQSAKLDMHEYFYQQLTLTPTSLPSHTSSTILHPTFCRNMVFNVH